MRKTDTSFVDGRGPGGPPAALALGVLDDAHALDPARVGVEHMELEARNGMDDLAAGRHPAERVEDHAADRVDRFAMLAGAKRIADHLGHFVDLGLAVDHEHAIAGVGDQRLVLIVMLVLDIADHHLDDVLQRDQPVGAAIFVDDQRHLRARRLHARHQVGSQHRRRHEQHGPGQAELADRLGEIDIGEVELGRSGPACASTSPS